MRRREATMGHSGPRKHAPKMPGRRGPPRPVEPRRKVRQDEKTRRKFRAHTGTGTAGETLGGGHPTECRSPLKMYRAGLRPRPGATVTGTISGLSANLQL